VNTVEIIKDLQIAVEVFNAASMEVFCSGVVAGALKRKGYKVEKVDNAYVVYAPR
jgi:hypothetical protein